MPDSVDPWGHSVDLMTLMDPSVGHSVERMADSVDLMALIDPSVDLVDP